MNVLSWLGRAAKSIIGWFLIILFGGVGLYSLLDGAQDGFAMVAVSFLFAGIGVLLVRSVHRDRSRAEARTEEETQYRRRQEEKAQLRAEKERQEAVPYVAVECPGCGAVARVRKGGVSRCEYCGSALAGK